MRGRVFILGAGASRNDTMSAEYPSPLATEFFDRNYVNAFWRGGVAKFRRSKLGIVLRQYFGIEAASGEHVNVEEVYSFLDLAPALVRRPQLVHTELLDIARSELRRYITRVIRETGVLSRKARLYPWLARNLGEWDSIISFNWDTLLDTALYRGRIPHPLLLRWWELLTPAVPPSAQALDEVKSDIFDELTAPYQIGGNIIKLHGSINLARCVRDSCRRQVFPYRVADTSCIDDAEFKCLECGDQLDVMLVPPHVHKSYLTNMQLKFLASVAALELTRASEIIIIGYSFPRFDFESQSLFRVARLEPWEVGQSLTNLNRVVLVNPEVKDCTYVQKVTDLLGVAKSAAHGQHIPLVLYETVDGFLAEQQRRPTPHRS